MLLVALTAFALPAMAQGDGTRVSFTPYFALQSFRWEELDDRGVTRLVESGPLYTFGVAPRVSFHEKCGLRFGLDIRYSFGYVDYLGYVQTSSGHEFDVIANTVYNHLEGRASIGYTVKLGERVYVTPNAGIGLEWWHRDLGAGARVGYDERYVVTMAVASLEAGVDITSDVRVFTELSFNRPLKVVETVDIASRGQGGPSNLRLRPGLNPQYEVQVGMTLVRMMVSLTYDRWRLSQSPPSQGFYQPDSKRGRIGLRVGYTIGPL